MAHGGAAGTKPLTSSVFYILMALADENRHGLGIVHEVERRTAGEVQLGPGTLYNAIKKMLAAGLIAEPDRRPPPELDDPRRRYYRITASGRSTVEREAARLERIIEAAREKKLLPESRSV